MHPPAVTRRSFLRAAAVTAAATSSGLRLPAGARAADCPPPGLPGGLTASLEPYENWAGEVRSDGLWTCTPRSAEDVCALADWAAQRGWRLRARGGTHGWSPLTVAAGEGCQDRVLLLDTRGHLGGLSVGDGLATAGGGLSLDALAAGLLEAGWALPSIPTTGTITVGGMLAIAAHGPTAGAAGERPGPGQAFGSVANQVEGFSAVVWDPGAGRHVVRTFDRSSADGAALLCGLGRTLVTEVRLRVGAAERWRCLSRTDVPAGALFAVDGQDSFAARLDATGRLEVLWYPYTEGVWLREWSVAPRRPSGSREVTGPYNYPFADSAPRELADLAARMVTGEPQLAPAFSRLSFEGTRAGLDASHARDLWGWSPHLLLHHEARSFRLHEGGIVLLTRRSDLGRVLHAVAAEYQRLLDAFRARGVHPVNAPAYIRATGVDDPAALGFARAPALSPARPHPDLPEHDTALWFDPVCFPGTQGHADFIAQLERFCRTQLAALAVTRSEWSKGWAYGSSGAWTDDATLDHVRSTFPDWQATGQRLGRMDAHGVFRTALHGRLGL